jgi:hypothetical protein
MQVFRCGRVPTAGCHWSGRSVAVDTVMAVAITEQRMDEERHWTVKELAEHAVLAEYGALNFTIGLKNTQDCCRMFK